MNSLAIKAENLSKAYQLGEYSTGTISRDIERWWHRIRGKEDPFLKIGETNDRTVKGNSDVVWSLKDINFQIKQGEAVGIIGRNGAGKSTLLKLLSRVTSPTSGEVKIKGRIASLLEVGTGFHPELTGRENIFLNGAILGMRKHEIKRKFDKIVDFAGVERYIDTPVKRYSSGMYVRLAFAVAAHLESEILIVDEVLAVGDAEFQKKCLGKMGEVSKGEGRTVLFVSHNMGSILSLCDSGIVLNCGKVVCINDVRTAIDNFSKLITKVDSFSTSAFSGNLVKQIFFESINVNSIAGANSILSFNDDIIIKYTGTAFKNFNKVIFIVSLFYNGTRLFTLRELPEGREILEGTFSCTFKLKGGLFRPGDYSIGVGAWAGDYDNWIWGTDVSMFTIAGKGNEQLKIEDIGILDASKLIVNE